MRIDNSTEKCASGADKFGSVVPRVKLEHPLQVGDTLATVLYFKGVD